jgi:hypothetical protein
MQMDILFILDGGPVEGPCSLSECFEPSAGTYEVCNADTLEYLSSVQLCAAHGKELATGLPGLL